MLRTIVVSISNFVCRILEPFRTDYAGCGCVCCEDARYDLRQVRGRRGSGSVRLRARRKTVIRWPTAWGFDPDKLDNGRCGCDRPRWNDSPVWSLRLRMRVR